MTNSTSELESITDAPPYGELVDGGEKPDAGKNHIVLATHVIAVPTHVQTAAPSGVWAPYVVPHVPAVGIVPPLLPDVVQT